MLVKMICQVIQAVTWRSPPVGGENVTIEKGKALTHHPKKRSQRIVYFVLLFNQLYDIALVMNIIYRLIVCYLPGILFILYFLFMSLFILLLIKN